MHLIELSVLEYFQRNHPARMPDASSETSNRPRGLFAECRAEIFQKKSSILNIHQKTGGLWSTLIGSVYQVSNHPDLAVLVALYPDGTVLWLDDHASDDDFAVFVHREHLQSWLLHRAEQLAQLIAETKCNYLGQPQLISAPSDIPPLAAWWLESDQGAQEAREQEERLASISAQIHPPTVIQNCR